MQFRLPHGLADTSVRLQRHDVEGRDGAGKLARKQAFHGDVTVCHGADDDAAFEELKKHFTTKQIVEMTFMCGMWNLSARLTEPFHQTCEPPEARIGFKAK